MLAFDALKQTEAEQGAAYVFACSMKEKETDVETIRNHIKKVIIGVD
jgi:hypothetical protein